jgi:hypothetical protein
MERLSAYRANIKASAVSGNSHRFPSKSMLDSARSEQVNAQQKGCAFMSSAVRTGVVVIIVLVCFGISIALADFVTDCRLQC